MTWLREEVLIEKIFKATKDITIILKAITRRCENGTPSLVKRGNSEQWKAWLFRHLGLVDRKDYILTSVDNIAYANRTWCENILPLIIKQKTPVNIICYSGEREPQKARSKRDIDYAFEDFQTAFEKDNLGEISLEALCNYIKLCAEMGRREDNLINKMMIAEKMYLKAEKKFSDNERFNAS